MLLHCNTNQNTLIFDRSLNAKFISQSLSLSKESIHTKLNQYISKDKLAILICAFIALIVIAVISVLFLAGVFDKIAKNKNCLSDWTLTERKLLFGHTIGSIMGLLLFDVILWYIVGFNVRAHKANGKKANELFPKNTTEADLNTYTQSMLKHTLTQQVFKYATIMIAVILVIYLKRYLSL